MRAVWIGGELFLLRLVTIAVPGGVVENRVQGAWLNAAEVKSRLLAEVADLLPLGDGGAGDRQRPPDRAGGAGSAGTGRVSAAPADQRAAGAGGGRRWHRSGRR